MHRLLTTFGNSVKQSKQVNPSSSSRNFLRNRSMASLHVPSEMKMSADTLAFIKSLRESARRSAPRSSVVLAAALFQTGQDLYGAGRLDMALESYTRSLTHTEHALGTFEHENIAKILYHIATTYHARGELGRAYEAFHKVWRISTFVLGEEEVAESLFQMGRVQRDLRQYECAIDTFREALKVRVKIHGRLHKDVAVIVCNIAMVYSEKGDLDVALSLFQEVLRIGLSIWGPVSKLNVEVLGMIGDIYMAMGEHDFALDIFDDAHRIAIYAARHELDHGGVDHRKYSAMLDQVLMPSVLSALVCVPRFCARAA